MLFLRLLKQHPMKTYEGVEIQVHAFLTWALLDVTDRRHTQSNAPPGSQSLLSFDWGPSDFHIWCGHCGHRNQRFLGRSAMYDW
jgi:hypothetical protein